MSTPMDVDETTPMEVDETDDDLDNFPSTSASTSNNAAPGQRFTLVKWDAPAVWSWDVQVDNCAICRNLIMDPCIECQAAMVSGGGHKECTVAWGACNHAFHLHCISRWLNTRDVCPLDNTKWTFQRFGR